MGYCKAIQSGDYLEIYEYEKELRPVENHGSGKKRVNRVRLPTASRNEHNLRRSRSLFIRLVSSNLRGGDSPAFFTFTMLDVVGIREGYRIFTAFIKRLRREFGGKFKYIAVPEFQKRGAVHFHVLIWGLNHELVATERESRRIQNIWGYGYVDCIPTDGNLALAGYMGKYMFKAMHDVRLRAQKAYSCGRDIMRPVSFSNRTAIDYLKEAWSIGENVKGIGDNALVKSVEFNTMWLGRCNYKSYRLKFHES